MNKSAKYWYEKYKNGENISQNMRKESNSKYNSSEIIEMSYELQASTYIESMKDKKAREEKVKYCNSLYNTIIELCNPKSILEAGIGEGTTLLELIRCFSENISSYGFDLSWSRVAYANRLLHQQGIKNFNLCTGNLLDIPFLENSIDIVYTSHSIEPNRGKEKEILQELYRVTKKYLILLEPAYELTNQENRKRMDYHGYCRNLKASAEELGYSVIKYELFKYCSNEVNPTALIIIEKNKNKEDYINREVFADPIHKTKLQRSDTCFYSSESMSVFPIVNNIPCLRIENKILAVKFEELNKNNELFEWNI